MYTKIGIENIFRIYSELRWRLRNSWLEFGKPVEHLSYLLTDSNEQILGE